jgi:hypothetical protein
MGAGCPFITCAVKKKGIELCTDCPEGETCDRWARHREASLKADSFICYQKLQDNIRSIGQNGIRAFEEAQERRCRLLEAMLAGYDDGRSKSFYCVAATVLEIGELEQALASAVDDSLAQVGFDRETKAFKAHITIGRVKESKFLGALARGLGEVDASDLGTQRVLGVAVMQSELRREGSIYSPVCEFDLAGE